MRASPFEQTAYRTVSELKKLATIIGWAEECRCARLDPTVRVLELGCGTGNISLPLASLGFSVLGTDVDPASVTHTASLNRFEHAHFQILDLEDADALECLPTFDVVICSEVIQYLSDPRGALHHMRRLVARRGYLILTTPNAWGMYALGSEMLGRARSVAPAPLRRVYARAEGHPLGDGPVSTADRDRPSLNATLPRPRFLSARQLGRFLGDAGFVVREWKNSDLVWFGGHVLHRQLAKLNCSLADHVPRFLASGWYLKCE